MKQLGLANHNYHDVYKKLPALGCRGMGADTGIFYSGLIGMLPFIEQGPLYDGIITQSNTGGGYGLPAPWSTADDVFHNNYWKVDIETFICPSEGAEPTNRGESPSLTSYKFCVGDDYHQNHGPPDWWGRDNRGVYQPERWVSFASITDGTSNTVMMGEVSIGTRSGRDLKGGVAVNQQAWDPAECTLRYDVVTKQLTGDVREEFRPPGGRAWDGRPYFVGFCTLIPPNGPSCQWGGVDGNEHLGTLSSNHPSGGHVVMSDGSVHFITDTIDGGDQTWGADSADLPLIENPTSESHYGVWGALGSRNGTERVPIDGI
jgi:hypothetical protein